MTSAAVKLYGSTIGTIAWDTDQQVGVFQYDPGFTRSGIQVAPVQMPLREAPYSFPQLNPDTFKGLPGMLADALPDKFGNLLIDQWLARENREPASFNPVERLCYLGNRAMGALEFEPTTHRVAPDRPLAIDALVNLANDILSHRSSLETTLIENHEEDALADILRVGTSAGGARAKAVIAWHPVSNQIRSGQIPLEEGYEPWLIKFDGIEGNADKELSDPRGYGRIEYAYHLMARDAGIEMSECRLLEESGRAHFMTRRFDRTPSGDKLHLQTLCALGHYDFNQAGGYSYEQAFQIARRIGLTYPELEELYRRAVFNVLARNQDDHTKNISFMMNRNGQWALAPAYDVTFSYNPKGLWTGQHQMTFNAKRDDFTLADLLAVATRADVKPRRAKTIINDIRSAIDHWSRHAYTAGIASGLSIGIARQFRTIR
ncbi:MAG: type II toxin-antitoxin system HipA family toxin [Verrucomicrobiaceae bacterium]